MTTKMLPPSLFKKLKAAAAQDEANPPKPRNSIWELTADALHHTDPRPPTPDTIIPSPILEVSIDDAWLEVPPDMFAAWTGRRRINGELHHGPVYHLGTTTLYTGSRFCPCNDCQATAAPHLRYN